MSSQADRRAGTRVHADTWCWRADAVLRPGVLVRVINIGPCGVLVESPARLRPGHRAELQLTAQDGDRRHLLVGRVARCQVLRLAPLCFRGAIAFDLDLDIRVLEGRRESATR
ncbi:MAG: hypothetical protein R2712_11990 [Vicinamibacterales bacterium]